MNNATITIAKKELMGLMYAPLGYVMAGLMSLLAVWLFVSDLFAMGSVDVSPLISSMSFLLSVFVPVLGMGIIAEERKNGTWENLMTWPVSERQIVVGKFLGYAAYLVFCVLLCAPVLLSLMLLGYQEVGILATNLMMLTVLAWCFLGVTMVVSSLTSQPMLAMGGSVIILLVNSLMGNTTLTNRFAPGLSGLLTQLSLSWRTQRMGSGLVEADNVWFLATFLAVSLVLTTLIIKSRNK